MEEGEGSSGAAEYRSKENTVVTSQSEKARTRAMEPDYGAGP